jgi:hypothetical protein
MGGELNTFLPPIRGDKLCAAICQGLVTRDAPDYVRDVATMKLTAWQFSNQSTHDKQFGFIFSDVAFPRSLRRYPNASALSSEESRDGLACFSSSVREMSVTGSITHGNNQLHSARLTLVYIEQTLAHPSSRPAAAAQ